jgi:uncharacterized membrane protein YeiH
LVWEVLGIIGTIAFAVSGALVALEEDYDLFGVLVLGFVTAFGGGIIRNVLIGVPVPMLWEQETLITIALASILLVFVTPAEWLRKGKKWYIIFDAVGLSAFAIQGAMMANAKSLPLIAVVTAAVLTGIGGGVIRDVLAGRKPLVFRQEIYALWAVLAGVVIHSNIISGGWAMYGLFAVTLIMRLVSLIYHWRLPHRFVKI